MTYTCANRFTSLIKPNFLNFCRIQVQLVKDACNEERTEVSIENVTAAGTGSIFPTFFPTSFPTSSLTSFPSSDAEEKILHSPSMDGLTMSSAFSPHVFPGTVGTGGERRLGRRKGSYLSFAVARAIVRKVKLRSHKKWREWCKAGQRPSNIPADPSKVYRDDGWTSMPDWLGYAGQAQHKDILPYAAARAIARKLKLKSEMEWKAWCKTGQRPANIPSHPEKKYRDDGWISWPDWLGYTGVAQHKDMIPFAAARAIVRKLKLKGRPEWREWC